MNFVMAVFSQVALRSNEEDYYDYLSITGRMTRPFLGYRTLSDSTWEVTENQHPWEHNNLGTVYNYIDFNSDADNFFLKGIDKSVKAKYFGPEWYNSYNTILPFGFYDGAMWQGVGYNTSLTAGLWAKAFGLTLVLKPQLSFSENRPFEYLHGVYGKEESYFTADSNIDLVQRYGKEPFWNFDWGDSEVRYDFYNFTVGFGTELPWIGPAVVNPMLGSNNTASYPKMDIGIRKTDINIPFINWSLGEIEARVWTGMLTESDYFDNNESNNYRMLNALSVSFAPSFIPGFSIGGNRIFLTPWKMENLKYLGRLFTLSRDNDVTGEGEDQKVALFLDWVLPLAGFEFYGEFGIDDFSSDEWTNPFHTGIYTVGVKQNIPLWAAIRDKGFCSVLNLEFNGFEMSQDFQLQWRYGGYYTHSQISQGYTNKGQILGAGTGWFGNSQYIGYTVYYPKGKSSLYFHRWCPNVNYILNKAVNDVATSANKYYALYETYFNIGFSSSWFVTPNVLITGAVDYLSCFDYMYIQHNYKRNFRLVLSGTLYI